MEPKIGIVMPVRNCLGLTAAAVDSIRSRHPYQVYIVDDHSDAPMKAWLSKHANIVTVPAPDESTGLAFNWNVGIATALNDSCGVVVVANNDVLFHDATIDALVDRLARGDVLLVTASDVSQKCSGPRDLAEMSADDDVDHEYLDFALFAITEDTIRRLGWFDEAYRSAYYEDNDYQAMMAVNGARGVQYGRALFYHYGNGTVKSHPKLQPAIQQMADHNCVYFTRKWGHPPINDHDEMPRAYQRLPFNGWHPGRPPIERSKSRLAEIYWLATHTSGPFGCHLPYLYRLGSTVNRITCAGRNQAGPASAFLYAQPERITIHDQGETTGYARLTAAARHAAVPVDLRSAPYRGDEDTDLLLLSEPPDDPIPASSTLQTLMRRVRRFVVIHHGLSEDAPQNDGICKSLVKSCSEIPGWTVWQHFSTGGALTVLARSN